MSENYHPDLLYHQNGIVVRPASEDDVAYLRDHMRASDVAEIYASHHSTPGEALLNGLRESSWVYTVVGANPIAMFGVNPTVLTGERATVWLLATDELDTIKRRFLRHSREFIRHMLDLYPVLENFVDCRNTKAIEWLLWLGAKMSDPVIFGMEKMPFRYFVFTKERDYV